MIDNGMILFDVFLALREGQTNHHIFQGIPYREK